MRAILNTNLFKGEPISTTLYCRCGAIWRAHDKLRKTDDGFAHEVSELCPNCESNTEITRSSTDPENWSIR